MRPAIPPRPTQRHKAPSLNANHSTQAGKPGLLSLLSVLLRLKSSLSTAFKLVLFFGLSHSPCAFAEPAHSLATPGNRLLNHPSPYLAMHAQDPVAWQEWSDSLLALARQQQKPILISSGYFACHWCHVMQHENYRDADAAALINDHFIAVKLDRELHPELDHYLLEFARQVSGRAGWPQHVLLTPDGLPFAAFGYLKNPAFKQRLQHLNRLWLTQRSRIQQLAQAHLTAALPPTAEPPNAKAFIAHLFKALSAQADPLSGGLLQGAAKFPQTPLLLNLIQLPDLGEQEEWLLLTLEQMQNEHLQDPIHGGFFRYTVDPQWQTPHFEKMLYDNALLAELYFLAAQRWQRDDFRQTGERTLNYLETHLLNARTGLFKSSQSALDEAGREGGVYLWHRQALQRRLPPEWFDVLAPQIPDAMPFEHGYLPRPTPQHWPQIRAYLSTAPAAIPHDSKQILGWNGLVLSAYVRAHAATARPDYLHKASQLAQRLLSYFQQAGVPRALDRNAQPIGQAQLEDYAYVLRGLTVLQHHQADAARAAAIAALLQRVQHTFSHPRGWQSQHTFLLPGQQRLFIQSDTATPSPTAILERLLPRVPAVLPHNLTTQPLQHTGYLSVLPNHP